MSDGELLKMNIIIDEDGWVNWVILPNGMSGNDPLEEFVIILQEFKDEFYDEVEEDDE